MNHEWQICLPPDQSIPLETSMRNEMDIEEAIERLIRDISDASMIATLELTSDKKKDDLPMNFREKICRKRRFRKRWQSTKSTDEKKALNKCTSV